MSKSLENSITCFPDKYVFTCRGCGAECSTLSRKGAIAALKRKTCKFCSSDARRKNLIGVRQKQTNEELGVYQRSDGSWCSPCPNCGAEKVYSLQKHARNSARGEWLCRDCATSIRVRRAITEDGFYYSDINQFIRSAKSRNLEWSIDFETVKKLWEVQRGRCALSGLAMVRRPRTWSIDRIDNDFGYKPDNVHLVDKRINMMKRNLSVAEFVKLCKHVAEKHSS